MNLPDNYFSFLCKTTPRKLAYHPSAGAKWRFAVRRKLIELLHLPPPTPPHPVPSTKIVEKKELKNVIREKIILKMPPPCCDTPAFLFKPLKPLQPTTGILCLHGHGGYYAGKNMVADYEGSIPIAKECAEALNYTYGKKLAEKGYYTICPDAFHFGEKLPTWEKEPKDEICARWHIALSIFGLNAMGLTIIGNMAALSYLLSLPEIKNKNAGCVGLSFGGVQTIFMTAIDQRIQAAVISGALFNTEGCLKNGIHLCGAQSIPNMLKWFDFPDILASLAPKPVLYEIMKKDGCFDYKKAKSIYSWLKSIYKKENAEENISLDVANTDHRYSGKLVEKFFARNLLKKR